VTKEEGTELKVFEKTTHEPDMTICYVPFPPAIREKTPPLKNQTEIEAAPVAEPKQEVIAKTIIPATETPVAPSVPVQTTVSEIVAKTEISVKQDPVSAPPAPVVEEDLLLDITDGDLDLQPLFVEEVNAVPPASDNEVVAQTPKTHWYSITKKKVAGLGVILSSIAIYKFLPQISTQASDLKNWMWKPNINSESNNPTTLSESK
jgi:hypothetical protein